MSWPSVNPGTVTVTEVAPDPIRPSVAFCSLQPSSGGPLTKDGEEVPLNDGVMTIELDEGDTLMCDWYRFPGGVTAGDEGDGGDDGRRRRRRRQCWGRRRWGRRRGGGAAAGGAVVLDPETGEADEELTGAQIFVRAWDCAADVQRPEVLDVDYAQGLAELTDACAPSEGSYAFSLDDGTEDDEALVDDGEVADEDQDADADDAVDGDDFQGIVAEDGTVVDEEGEPDEAVAGGPSGEGEGDGEDDGGNQGIVAGDEEADEGDGEGDGDENGAGDGAGVGVYEPIQADGDTYRGWNGLAAGGYTILETVPEGYDQLVLCDGIFAGAEAGANIFELTPIDGAVIYDLAEGERLLCNWFNRLAGDADGEGMARTTTGTGTASSTPKRPMSTGPTPTTKTPTTTTWSMATSSSSGPIPPTPTPMATPSPTVRRCTSLGPIPSSTIWGPSTTTTAISS